MLEHRISPVELKEMLNDRSDIIIFDTRTYSEYHRNSIPGAINVPGAELVYRFKDMVPSAETTVVINCGGRTRSIIGAEALRVAGFPNRIVSLLALKVGTLQDMKSSTVPMKKHVKSQRRGWQKLKLHPNELQNVRVLKRSTLLLFVIGKKVLKPELSYLFDVRTSIEFEAGHLKGAKHIPGGQLVQETDRHCGVWGKSCAS